MILVEKITIEEFRGIRKLILNFKRKNFAVCGPNGTGKSGVVDALEFGLTGNISRLSGRGTGGITLRDHAPHVDYRNNPEKARVLLNLLIPSLNNKHVTVERNVKEPLTPKVTPNTADVLEILKQLENHPEFVLSRRELITYVLATPGDRSAEVQALLRLDQVGELRRTFKTISNFCNRETIDSKKSLIQTRDHLAQALEIPELVTKKLLEAVNSRRTILGLGPIETLTGATSLRDGLETDTKVTIPLKINKIQALSDVKKTHELLQKISANETSTECNNLLNEITVLSTNPTVVNNISRETFLRTAINLITENSCPVCDTEWDVAKLRNIIQTKLRRFEEIAKARTALEQKLVPIIDVLGEFDDVLVSLEQYAKIIAKEQITPLINYRLDLAKRKKNLRNFLPLIDTISSLNNLSVIPVEITTAIDAIEAALIIIPEPTQQTAARDYLILCQERLENYRTVARNAEKTEQHATLAKKVHDIYVEASNKELEGVYKKVEEKFGEFYRFINSDDEGHFTAHLTPSLGKLGFNVEFYGRGHFPPGAYHSEGHQDGMGLCLYLALMQQLQGDKFIFAVLDDVLMSVDTGHRREVCNLLKESFPKTQFILTTHDDVWLKHMVSAGLINSADSVRFSNWTPDHGPTEWNNRDTWTEIDSALKQDKVHVAASALRYYLEYIFKEVCNNLHAPVEFKGDGRYELGDLLYPAVQKLREILLNAKLVAVSWGKITDTKVITALEKNLSDYFHASNADQWQINPAVHYNEWANLTSADFSHVVTAFHNLVQQFFCRKPKCGGLLYLTMTPPKTFDTLRCACGATNLNLKKRKPSH